MKTLFRSFALPVGFRLPRFRLAYRVAAMTVLVLAPVVVASGFALVTRAVGYLWQEAEQDSLQLSEIVVGSIRRSMLAGELERVHEACRLVSPDRSIRSLRLYDRRGRTSFPRSAAAPGSLPFDGHGCTSCHGDPSRVPAGTGHCWQWNGAALVLHTALRNEPACAGASCHPPPAAAPVLGVLRLETDVSSVFAKAGRLRTQGAAWGAAILFAVSLPPLLVFRVFVEKPLRECVRLVREVSEENLRVRSRFHPTNEWGDLLRSFDGMVAALFKTRVALEALNRDLEGQVGQRTRELKQALEAAQQSDRMKTEFLANLSHEFSTPIQGVIGFSQLLLDGIDGELVPAQREDVETILRNGRRLLDWVEDLLELARLDGGSRILCVDRLRLEDLAEEAVEAGRARARGKPLLVVYEPGAACPPVFGEVAALRRVLVHLVANAVRHTQVGTVRVSVEPRGPDWVCVRVEDTGPGIDQAVLAAALGGFGSKPGGGGLSVGLSLVRRLIELHRGTFELVTAPGEGTRVALTLPVAPPADDGEA